MTKIPMEKCDFKNLFSKIKQETDTGEKKLATLYKTKGFFTGSQAAELMYAFWNSCDKLMALDIIDRRLTKMSTEEAKDILQTFSFDSDKLRALKSIKRFIYDLQTKESHKLILDCFTQPTSLQEVCDVIPIKILTTKDLLPAGGHIIHEPLGSLRNQTGPFDPSMYASVYQEKYGEAKNELKLPEISGCRPPHYKDPCCNQMTSSSAIFNQKEFYGGCNGSCPYKHPVYNIYPSGDAPLGFHNPLSKVGF